MKAGKLKKYPNYDDQLRKVHDLKSTSIGQNRSHTRDIDRFDLSEIKLKIQLLATPFHLFSQLKHILLPGLYNITQKP